MTPNKVCTSQHVLVVTNALQSFKCRLEFFSDGGKIGALHRMNAVVPQVGGSTAYEPRFTQIGGVFDGARERRRRKFRQRLDPRTAGRQGKGKCRAWGGLEKVS